MRKTFTLLIALLALTVSSWATQITWNQADVQSVNVSCNGEYYYGPQSQAVNGISVTANTPNSGSNSDYSSFSYNTYSEPYFSSISVDGGGTLTFSSVGNITSIVIHTDENGYGRDAGAWTWSNEQLTLTWTGDATSVVLADNAYVSNITSIEFTVSVPSSYSLNQAAVQSINVSCNGEYYYGPQSQAVNGISVTANTPNSGSNSDYSSFSYNTYSEPYFSSISVDGGGTLTFSSVNMTSIVIHTDENGYGRDAGAWTWSNEQHTLTWTGDATSVVLADNAYVSNITSIDFTFATEDPTPDPEPVVTSVIWEGTDLTNVDVWASNSDPNFQTIEGSINIKVTATAPESEDYSQFKTYDENNTSISVDANGTLTFEPVSGKLTSIIIESDYAGRTETLVEGSGWDWIPSGEYSGQLKWTSETAEGESSVVLACNGSTYGCYFSYISSVKFTFAAEEAASADPVNQDPVTWDFANDADLAEIYLRQYTHYNFHGYYSEYYDEHYNETVKNFKGIVATISAMTEGSYACFSNQNNYSIDLENGGTLTFSTELGQFQSIVINTTSYYGSDSGEWAGNDTEHTLTWAGTPANSVVLNNIDISDITSIVFTFVSAAPAFTADITWDATEVATVSLYGSSFNTVVSGSEIDGITPSIMKTNDGYCYFDYSKIKMENNGELTFTSSVGDIQGIVLTFDNTNTDSYSISDFPVGWTLDEGAGTLTWSGTAAEEVSLAGNISCTVTSIEFDVIEEPAPVYPTPSGPSFIWQSRQVSHVLLNIDDNGDSQTTHVIKNIITSLERTAAKTDQYDFCLFANNGINIKNNGTLTFRSIVGDLTGIVITCGYKYYADDLSADWRYDSENGTLIWVGTPAETVTLSGNVDVSNISTIEFFYDPAPAPRKGETFFGIYNQYYQITGAHTAKLPAQDLNHTLQIPASVEDGGVTYYITEIDDYAFYGQAELPNVFGGANIAKIGAHAFDGCLQITDIDWYSDVLDTIGDAAFKDCKLMANFDCFTELPPVLGSNAFSGTTYLNRIRVNSASDYKYATNWEDYADKIYSMWENPAIGEQFFWHNQMTTNWYAVSSVSPVKEAKVLPYPAGVKAIYPRTLVGRLVIPEEITYLYQEYKVTGIGENAYKDSTRFYMVMIPQAVKSIESGAFLNCTGVENVQFLWDDPRGTVTWADANVGAEFKTAASGETKICVPKGTLTYYQEWAPAWASCMVEGEILDIDVTASEDPNHASRYYRTFYDSETDYLMPPSVWAHAGYVENGSFILSPVAFDGMVLPRGTAVVLESETPTYRLVPTGNTAPLYDGRNDLVGTDVDIPRTSVGNNGENVYVLNRQANIGGNLYVGMGMYQYTGTTLGAHKAYLIYDAPSGPNNAHARFVFKHKNEPTDVENVQDTNASCTKILRNGQLIIIKDGKEYNAQGLIIK